MTTLLSPVSSAQLLPAALLARSGCQRLIDVPAALAWLNVGDARLQSGDEGKAMGAYKMVLELVSKHARPAEVQGWIANPPEGGKAEAVVSRCYPAVKHLLSRSRR